MTQNLNLDILRASCSLVKDTLSKDSALGHMGIARDQFDKFIQEAPWMVGDRIPVQRVLTSLRDGMAAVIGFPPFKVPAEYQAALIHCFIQPANIQTACQWASQTSYPASDLALGAESATAPVSADQLFTLVLMARGNCKEFEGIHNRKVEKAITKAKEKENGIS